MLYVDAFFYVCNFCYQPYARDYGVISHIEFKHWTPDMRPKENFTKLSIKGMIEEKPYKRGARKRFTCTNCKTVMARSEVPGHICTDIQGKVTCLKIYPKGKTLINNDKRLLLYSDKRNLLCPNCGAMFSDRLNLDVHVMKEHGVVTERFRRHHCRICNKMFARKIELDQHNIRIHADGIFGTFVCDYCGQNFKSRNSLYCHRKFAHIVGKGYQCEHCPQKFFKRHMWITHTKRHLGEKPFLCTVCNKDFSSNHGLSVHMRIHNGWRPFACLGSGCDRSFIQRSGFVEHMQRRHPEIPIPSVSIRKDLSRKQANIQVSQHLPPASSNSNDGTSASGSGADQETINVSDKVMSCDIKTIVPMRYPEVNIVNDSTKNFDIVTESEVKAKKGGGVAVPD